jgi:hypothetical protein
MQKGDRRTYLIKVAIVWGITLLLILGIGALRTTNPNPDTDSAFASVISRFISKPPPDRPNPASRKRDYLKKSDWPQGLRIYRDWWKERDAAVYVAEMRRESKNLRFGVELANNRLLGRERISSMAGRLAQQDIPLLAGVNGSFGLRGDRVGRGGVIFNLHIQDWELVSIAPRRDWWGFPPPSPWGETSFGVTTDGEFLLDAVELNGVIHIDGESLEVDCINQIRETGCAAVIYTPRFGEQTLARRSYEVVLKGLELPLIGRYRSSFKIDAVNRRGNSTIPPNGVVLALDYQLAVKWDATFSAGGTGTLEIALSPTKWQRVSDGIGGNLRLLRNGKIEPELVEFHKSGGRSNYRHRNAARWNPRSALGFNDEKLFLIAVDGRQYGYSIGMTLYEMADFLRALGAKHAINFDGGGSSALWGLDSIVNRPSRGYERSVFNVAMITTQRKVKK